MWEAKAVEKTFTVNYYYEKDGQLYKADSKTGTGDRAAFTVISDVPAKGDWTFKGWVDDSNTAYAAGLDFDLSAATPNAIATDTTVTLNLYATWAAETPPIDTKTYTVNYVDEDGTTVAAAPESRRAPQAMLSSRQKARAIFIRKSLTSIPVRCSAAGKTQLEKPMLPVQTSPSETRHSLSPSLQSGLPAVRLLTSPAMRRSAYPGMIKTNTRPA